MMKERMITESEFLAAMRGLLGEEHPACEKFGADIAQDIEYNRSFGKPDEEERPAQEVLLDFIRWQWVPTLPDWEQAALACQIIADPHGIDLDVGSR